MEARAVMCYAQYLAGMAFNNASLGYVHAMAHQLGGFYNFPHGVCNAILLPHVSEFNLIAAPERFATVASLLGVNTAGLSTVDAARAAIAAIRGLSASIGIPAGLVALGVKAEDHVRRLAVSSRLEWSVPFDTCLPYASLNVRTRRRPRRRGMPRVSRLLIQYGAGRLIDRRRPCATTKPTITIVRHAAVRARHGNGNRNRDSR
ncbi:MULTISPECIES: iron-containing alcohol dehydrogenase [unclassified Burkholderia]|uniref:iron-containing alcohol dehydrogenase n=1 Tax=Burkholderia sp. MSMB1588 TaxID=1636423 RepID=UPI001E578B30|nr:MULTISPECIES: iron-containing alcohol dehydrogenase [unclassified Burkholderia]